MKFINKAKRFTAGVVLIGMVIALARANSNSGPVSASDQQVQAIDQVGKQGQKKVDLFTGSFSYSVPINCPPARNGSEPNLALAYSSAGDNDWCGMGWNLEIGFIERNVRDGFPIAYGTGSPALPLNQYNDSKGFMLDLFGKSYKLFAMATNGTVEFRAETDTDFLRCFFDTSNNQWLVYDKSGNVYYFGETSSSRISNPKTGWSSDSTGTFHWALDQIVTATGDLTTITYANNASPFTGLSEQTLYPTQIAYNGHSNYNGNTASSAAPNTIIFQTEVRANDWHFSFRSGFRTELDRRLTNIVCLVGTQNVWSYRLMYGSSPATARSLLTNVVVYGYNGSTATPYLTNSFAYQGNPNGVSFAPTMLWTNMVLNVPGGGTDPEVTQVNQDNGGNNYTVADLVDMDGDGLPDRVMYDASVTPNQYQVQKNLGLQNNGSGLFGTQYAFGPTSTGGGSTASDSNPLPDGTLSGGSGYAELNTPDGRIRDLNGDGLPDRVMDYWKPFDTSINPNNTPYTNFTVMLNNGNGFSNVTQWAVTNFIGPVDNDSAYLTYESVEGGGSVTFGGSAVQVGVGLFDINGDGLPDRVMTGFAPYTNAMYRMTNLYVQYNTGTNFSPIRLYPYKSQNWNGVGSGQDPQSVSSWAAFETSRSHFMDLNGDGLPDHLMWPMNPTNGYSGQEFPHPAPYYALEYNDGYSFESTNTSTGAPGAYDQWPGVVAQANNGTFWYGNIPFWSDAI